MTETYIPMRMIFEQLEVVDFHGRADEIAREIATKYGLIARVYVVEAQGDRVVSRSLGVEYKPRGPARKNGFVVEKHEPKVPDGKNTE